MYHIGLTFSFFHYLNSVMSNGTLIQETNKSTYDAYWERCRKEDLYIVGNTLQICSYSTIGIWTGLRKYKIGIRF